MGDSLPRTWLASCALLAVCLTPAQAQFKLQETFEGTTASGWTLTDSAILTLGVGPRFAVGKNFGIGVSVDYLNSTSQNQFWLFSATLEYHFR